MLIPAKDHAPRSKEQNSEAFAGQHASDSTSFYVFDEASAVPDAIYEVAEGGLTDGEPMIFMFGTVLFTLATGGAWNDAQIVMQSLDSGERQVVLRGGRDARYIHTGHLMYARNGTLLAVPFDLARHEVTGGPVPLVEGVRDAGATTGATHFSLSGDGSLVYVPGGPDQAAQRRLVWVSRNGAEQAESHRGLEQAPTVLDGHDAIVPAHGAGCGGCGSLRSDR